MTTADTQVGEFLAQLWSRITDRSIEVPEDTENVGVTAFREEAFTAVVLETLEDLGQIADVTLCYLDRRLGRGVGKVNAWSVDEDAGEATLVTTIHRGLRQPGSITRTELTQAIERSVRVFVEGTRGYFAKMEPASDAFDMMQRFYEVRDDVDRLRVVVLGDGYAADLGPASFGVVDVEVHVDIWDLRRLYRASSSGLPYEPVEIDLVERLGAPLPCIQSPGEDAEFDVYLAVVPGALLHDLYHEFGARLLELNVRSFLQARGKVNRGIRDTLSKEPEFFIAYNNGISATAEWVETTSSASGLGLRRIRGLQIVNGGQTVASIHRAGDRDKMDLTSVFVQAKLTVVAPEQVETLVPLISRYANTQNRVSEADFSANHPFHVRLQQVSQTIWAPGEQSRWFYERARGQYQVAQQREGTTKARLARFKQANPPRQRFDKVLLAKFENTWAQLPHVVSRGGQKNFVAFMQGLRRDHGESWEPDANYFRKAVAKAIMYKTAERIARAHGFPGYRANAIAYTVALLAFRSAGRLDLEAVWNAQEVSESVRATLESWMPVVYDGFVSSAGGRNVTEWCKKEDCWRHVKGLSLHVPDELEVELLAGGSDRAVGHDGAQVTAMSPAEREQIARVMQVHADDWVRLTTWGKASGHLNQWQLQSAGMLAGMAAAGWMKSPSAKLASKGVQILQIADEQGGLASDDEDQA